MKRLVHVSRDDLADKKVVATFRLVGGKVQVDAPEDVQEMFGLHRIFYRKVLTPSDGVAYYDALEVVFSQSTYCYVDTVPDDS